MDHDAASDDMSEELPLSAVEEEEQDEAGEGLKNDEPVAADADGSAIAATDSIDEL
jgi:hypothetical protein